MCLIPIIEQRRWKTPMLVGTPKTCYYWEPRIEAQADLPTFESVVGNKERSSFAFPSPTKIADAQFGLPWSHCNQIVDHGRKTWAGHPCMGGSVGQCLKSGDWGGAEGCLFHEHPHSKDLG